MKKIAVIAHDKYKQSLLDFLKKRRSWFYAKEIVATGRTADFLENGELDIPLIHVNKGCDGGYIQICKMIENNDIDMLFFFRDASITTDYHQDIVDLLNICDLNNVPLSTNLSGSELLIIGKIRMDAANQVLLRTVN
jgi:methylglyoxal synthase